jgi:hypothetical protein
MWFLDCPQLSSLTCRKLCLSLPWRTMLNWWCKNHLISTHLVAKLAYILWCMRLFELIMVKVIDLVKDDEWCFSMFTFTKIKLRNWPIKHLELVIWMFNYKFFIIQNFPFVATIQNQKQTKTQYDVEVWRQIWILQLPFVFTIYVLGRWFMNLQPFFRPLGNKT